jgi:hypothetical protein
VDKNVENSISETMTSVANFTVGQSPISALWKNKKMSKKKTFSRSKIRAAGSFFPVFFFSSSSFFPVVMFRLYHGKEEEEEEEEEKSRIERRGYCRLLVPKPMIACENDRLSTRPNAELIEKI